jgi:hypothetical protein
MRKICKWSVLFVAVAVFVLPGVAGAGSLEELEATVKQLQDKLKNQQDTIEKLKSQTGAGVDRMEQLANGIDAGLGNSKKLGWLDNMKFSGDLRLRYNFKNPTTPGVRDQHKGRLRVRFGVTKTWLDEQLEIGFRFATGSSDSPTSTNQDFGEAFAKKDLWLDLAYAKYAPKSVKGLTLIAGKMKNPLVHTDIIWDADVNPEGVAGIYQLSPMFEGRFVPYVAVGFFQIVHNSNAKDVVLNAYQGGFTLDVAKDVKWTSALTLYDFDHYTEPGNFPAAAGNTETVAGTLDARDFDVVNFTNMLSWKAFKLPMSAYYDFAHNSNNKYKKSNACAFGIEVGQNKNQGDWSVKYKYARIEANATPGAIADADFGGTDRKGHVIGGTYNLLKNVLVGMTAYSTEPINGSRRDETELYMVFDLLFKF